MPLRPVALEVATDDDFEMLRFSDDGRWLVGLGRNGEVRIWATSNGRTVFSHSPADDADKDGLAALFGASHGFAELQAGPAKKREYFDDSEKMSFVQFTADGFMLFSRKGELWRYANSQLTKQKLPLPSRQEDLLFVHDCMNTASTRKLISLGNFHALVDVASGREIRRIGDGTTETTVECLTKSDRLLAYALGEGRLQLLDMLNGQPVSTIATGEPIASVQSDPIDENIAISLSKGGQLVVWELSAARSIASREEVAAILGRQEDVLWTLMRDELAVAWRLPQLEKIGELRLPDGEQVASLSFSRDGQGTLRSKTNWEFRLSGTPPFTVAPIELPVTDGKDRDKTFQTSPDGARLVQRGPRPEDLRLIDAKTGQLIKELNPILLEKTRARVEKVRLATAGHDAPSRYQSADRDTPGDDGGNRNLDDLLAQAIDFTRDGKRLMQSLRTGGFRVWNAEDGSELVSRTEQAKAPDASDRVAFLGEHLVSYLTHAGDLELWSIEQRSHIAKMSGIAEMPELFGERPLIAIGGLDGSLRMLDATNGRELWSDRLTGGPVKQIYDLSSGNKVIAVSRDGTLAMWDVDTGKRLASLDHQGLVVRWIDANKDADRLWTLTSDLRLHVWTLSGMPVGSISFDDARSSKSTVNIDKVFARPDLAIFVFEHAVANDVRTWWIWNEITRSLLPAKWSGNPDLSSLTERGGWWPNSTGRILEQDPTGALRLRNSNGEPIATLVPGAQRPDDKLSGSETPQMLVASNGDGTRIATTGGDGAQLWDGASGKALMRLGSSEDVVRLEFVADGRLLLTVRADGGIEFRRSGDGSTMSVLPGADAQARVERRQGNESIRRFLSGNQLALTSNGGVWNIETGKRMLSNVLAADDAGARILWPVKSEGVFDAPKGLEVLEATTGTVIAAVDLGTGGKPVVAGKRDPDSLRIVDRKHGFVVAADVAGAVRVWSLEGGKLIHSIDPGKASVSHLAVHPQRSEIAVAHDSGAVDLWDVDERKLVATLESRRNGGFGQVQRRREQDRHLAGDGRVDAVGRREWSGDQGDRGWKGTVALHWLWSTRPTASGRRQRGGATSRCGQRQANQGFQP